MYWHTNDLTFAKRASCLQYLNCWWRCLGNLASCKIIIMTIHHRYGITTEHSLRLRNHTINVLQNIEKDNNVRVKNIMTEKIYEICDCYRALYTYERLNFCQDTQVQFLWELWNRFRSIKIMEILIHICWIPRVKQLLVVFNVSF